MNEILLTVYPTNGQKSFYDKAKYTVEHEHTIYTYTLYSYNTKIMSITVNSDNHATIHRYWYDYTATTMKHINSFMDIIGVIRGTYFEGRGKKWWESLPDVSEIS